MDFRDPLILLLLLLALAPVIIHFLMRLRTKRVPWGANYLLERAIRRARREKQWLYYLLLALRCLVAALLVTAFARPFLYDPGGEIEGRGLEQVVVINDGYNLGHTVEATSLWEDSLELLDLLASTWPVGTTYSVYGTAGGLDAWITGGRKESAGPLSRTLQSHQPRDGAVNLPLALEQLERQRAGAPYQLTVISLDQANQWEGFTHLRPLAASEAMWLIPGTIEGWNARLVDLELPASRALRGDTLQATAVVALSGNADSRHAVVVELSAPGQPRQRARVPLQPGQSVRVPFDFILTGEGDQDVTIRADIREADALARDNSIERVVRVLDGVPVLLPPPASDTRVYERAVDWLTGLNDSAGTALALQAEAGGTGWIEQLPSDGLVVIDDLAPADPASAQALLDWVNRGGSLIIGGGPGLRPELWPRELLGGEWAGMRLQPTGGAQFQRVETAGFESRPVATLADSGSDGLGGMKVYGYWEVQPDDSTTVLGMLDNGAPWLMVRNQGLGSVVLLSSGLSGRWNNLPVLPSFTHVYYRLATLALQGTKPPLNLQADAPLLIESDQPGRHVLAGPTARADRITLPLAPVQASGLDLLRLDQAPAHLGTYALVAVEAADAPNRFITVDDSRPSGIIDRMPPDQRQSLVERQGWTLIESETGLRRFLEAGGAGRELYAWVMAALLLFILTEAWIGRKLAR